MNIKSHETIVREKLIKDGVISRNWALRRYIGRLASRIHDLKETGIVAKGKSVKTPLGRDYEYYLVK